MKISPFEINRGSIIGIGSYILKHFCIILLAFIEGAMQNGECCWKYFRHGLKEWGCS